MYNFYGFFFVIIIGYVCAQSVVNRVFLIDNRGYMTKVIQEVMYDVEARGWSNLELLEIKNELEDIYVMNQTYSGTVTYKNGFLVSIKHLDVLSSSLNQIWNVTEGEVRVHVGGQLRMTDATLGYDIEADLQHGLHHYTGSLTIPLMTFDFWVMKAPATHRMWVTIFGNTIRNANIKMDILPHDTTSDVLTSLFNYMDCEDGVRSWIQIFQPILEDVINHRVPFPDMCYNCPAT